jgi:predicted deacylase
MNGIEQVTKDTLTAVLEKCPILTQDTIRIVEQANKIISLETENAELKRQIAEGELIPVALIYDIVADFHCPGNGWRNFEDYAKMRAKEAQRKAAQ